MSREGQTAGTPGRGRLARVLSDRRTWVEMFATANLAFLVVDIWVAHSFNDFTHAAEWIPFVYAGLGALVLTANLASGTPFEGAGRWVGMVVGWAGIGVGVTGMVLHLESQFFQDLTLRSLVYSAPFVAPWPSPGWGSC